MSDPNPNAPPSSLADGIKVGVELTGDILQQVKFWTRRAHAFLWMGLPVLIGIIIFSAWISTFELGGELAAQIIMLLAGAVIWWVGTYPYVFGLLIIGALWVGVSDKDKQAFDAFLKGLEETFARILPLVSSYLIWLPAAAILVLNPAYHPKVAVLLLTCSIAVGVLIVALEKKGRFALEIALSIYLGAVGYCAAVLVTGGNSFTDTLALNALAMGIFVGLVALVGVSTIRGGIKHTIGAVWVAIKIFIWLSIVVLILWNFPSCTGLVSETLRVEHEKLRAWDEITADVRRKKAIEEGLPMPPTETEKSTVIVPPGVKYGTAPVVPDNAKWQPLGTWELPVVKPDTMHWHRLTDKPGTYQVYVKTNWAFTSQAKSDYDMEPAGKPCSSWKIGSPEFAKTCEASGSNYGEVVVKNLATGEIFRITQNSSVRLNEGSGPLVIGLNFPEPRSVFFSNIKEGGTVKVEVKQTR